MANPETQTREREDEQAEVLPAPLSTGVVASYESMLASIPDAGEGGYERILELIAQADDPAELDAAWRTDDLANLAGIPLTIRSISKAPSDFQGGLPWFLIIDAVNEVTGEKLTVTTGAVSVVAQLVRAFAIGALPLRARPVVSERPTSKGYYPQHLEVLK
jgi:hypothetical protein